jgi:hypothetical protein
MAETDSTDVLEDQIADVDLTKTDLSSTSDDAAQAADDTADDAAAAQDDQKPDAKAKDTDAADTSAKDQAEGRAKDAKAAEGEGKPQADEAQTDQKTAESAKADEGKTPEQLREEQQARARAEYINRQRTRNQIAEQIDQNFGPKTEEDLIAEGVDPADAKIQAMREEFAYKEQRAQVAELNAGMQAEAVNAENDFPVYRQHNPDGTKNPDFDPEFTKMVEQQYAVAARLQTQKVTDQYGNEQEIVTNAEVPLYDFYKRMADIYSRGTSRGSQQGQADMAAMMSRTENPGGSSSTKSGDSLEEMEARLGDVRIA